MNRTIKHLFPLLLLATLHVHIAFGIGTHLPSPFITVAAFAADSAEQRMIVGLSYGGFWLTNDGGESWEPINERICYYPLNQIYNVIDIEAWDSACDTILIRYDRRPNTYFQESLSTDGGETWEIVRPDLVNPPGISGGSHFTIQDQSNHNRLFHIDMINFSKSDDFNQTWQSSAYNNHGITRFGFIQDPQRDSTLFIYGPAGLSETQPEGILRSDDMGQNWSSIIDITELLGQHMVWLSDLERLSNGDLLISLADGYSDALGGERVYYDRLMRSEDDGATWVMEPNAQFPGTFHPLKMEVFPHQPERMVMIGGPSYRSMGALLSLDNGATFQPLLNATDPPMFSLYNVGANPWSGTLYLCNYVMGVAKSNDGPDWVMMDNLPEMGTSLFFGVHEEVLGGLINFDPTVVSYSFADQTWRSYTPSGASFDSTFMPSAILHADEDSLLVLVSMTDRAPAAQLVTQLFTIHRSTGEWNPRGERISPNLLHTGARILRWDRTDSLHIFGLQQTGASSFAVASTIDTGRTWQSHEAPWAIPSSAVIAYYPTPDGLMLSVPQTGVFFSPDRGATWQDTGFPAPHLMTGTTVMTYNEDGGEFYLSTSHYTYLYLDGEWETRGSTNLRIKYLVCVPSDPPVLVASTSNRAGSLHLSFDRGMTWGPDFRQELPYASQFFGTDLMKYDRWRQRIWIDSPVGIFYLDMHELAAPESRDESHQPQKTDLLLIHPNPANESTTVTLSLVTTGTARLALFDTQGRLAETVLNKPMQAGTHPLNLNLSHLASGTYFLKLETPNGTTVRRLTHLR